MLSHKWLIKITTARCRVSGFKQKTPLLAASCASHTVCHCERSEAIPYLDCFVVSLLAMTFPCSHRMTMKALWLQGVIKLNKGESIYEQKSQLF